MPYKPEWHNPDKSIIRVIIDGSVSWDEWYVMSNQIHDMMSAVSHRVDVIYDDKVGMPKGNPMPHLKTTISKLITQKNLGIVVTVSARRISGIVKAMVDIMMHAYRMDMSHYGGFVDTMDEALALIQSTRAASSTMKPAS